MLSPLVKAGAQTDTPGKDQGYDPSPIVVGAFTENMLRLLAKDPIKARSILKKFLAGDDLKAALTNWIDNCSNSTHIEISEEDFVQAPNTFNPKLDLRLEPGNFLSKYIEYAKTTSDAYVEYHFACGLVLLSVAVDRQIVVSMRHGDIYPNIWIFPIGDSTR